MPELFPQERRSKGAHVSHAIHTIMKSIYPDRFEDRPIDITRANLGNALEKAIIRGLAESNPERFVIPGELFYDDLYGTPDLWDVGGRKLITCEVKLTWASSRRAEDIEDSWFWRYWVQLKAYAHMAGGCDTGRLYIGFINGDYTRSEDTGGPKVLGWEDSWSKAELEENWEMLKAQPQ